MIAEQRICGEPATGEQVSDERMDGLRHEWEQRVLYGELASVGRTQRAGEPCIGHSEGATSADPTIGACWDADRLDLGRVGTRPRAEFLSLPAARDPALIAWAHRRATAWRGRRSGTRRR